MSGKRVRHTGLGEKIRGISQPTRIYILSTQKTHEQGVYGPRGNMKTVNKNMNR